MLVGGDLLYLLRGQERNRGLLDVEGLGHYVSMGCQVVPALLFMILCLELLFQKLDLKLQLVDCVGQLAPRNLFLILPIFIGLKGFMSLNVDIAQIHVIILSGAQR